MKDEASSQELHHEIFGSVLDRAEMTPYLLLKSADYATALKQATRMMGNRGFDTCGSDDLDVREKERATRYIDQAYRYCFDFLFPSVRGQLERLKGLESPNHDIYLNCARGVDEIASLLSGGAFRELTFQDPRHLFLMASSRKYPHVFHGYRGAAVAVPPDWQQLACSLLKVAHLIKSIEEDSQDINDCARLGIFLQTQGQSLHDLYDYAWDRPQLLPDSEAAQRAFVKISTFFHKLRESINFDTERGCLVFDSGDGVAVDIVRIESRLKSPESMFTKLGKNAEGEAYDIRDLLAITFILNRRDDTLKLFHALQKRGVILQENTISCSITQTLFESPESMVEAVRSLVLSLSRSEGTQRVPDESELLAHTRNFYRSLRVATAENPHSSGGHKKFQCKINFFVPVHRKADTREILIPGTALYAMRHRIDIKTEQHTLALELRITDEQSWNASERGGDSHHEAYKTRQLVSVMNRLFKDRFNLPEERFRQLRKDQARLYSACAQPSDSSRTSPPAPDAAGGAAP
jgi:uncharacterized protein (TIGR04562 family)